MTNDDRTIKDSPFCWQAKDALRRIAEGFSDTTGKAHANSVYLSLTWFASDNQSESFKVEKGRIAERAGVSYRKCADVLTKLAGLGLVEITKTMIEGTKEQGPNWYRLLGMACPTSGTECLRLGTVACKGSVPRLIEESTEESEKNFKKKAPPFAQADLVGFAPPATPSVLTFPTAGKARTWELTTDLLTKLTEAYPGLDVLAESKKALAKIETGAVRSKTARGMPKFLWSWMDRAQNSCRPGPAIAPAFPGALNNVTRA